MNHQEALTYVYGLERLGIKLGLSVMEQLMEALGHPERTFKSVHVTGTNGKGSTCALIESVLRESGKKTALYTSPHLYRFNERIRVMNIPISDDELVALIVEVKKAADSNGIQPTFFEFTSAVAFLHFSRAAIDIAIIEVGMGGRYDATNVITPLVSVITNIGLDHMEFLGHTKEEIAYEKAGIIKEGVPIITGEQDERLFGLFEHEAVQKHAHIYHTQDILRTVLVSSSFEEQTVQVLSSRGAYSVELPLLGKHQVKNLALALAAVSIIDADIPVPVIQAGVAHTVWEGRMQIVSKNPLIVVDGAHNADGVEVLVDFLKGLRRHDVLVIGIKKGKDMTDMIQTLIPLFRTVIVTKGSYMPEDPERVAAAIRPTHSDVRIFSSVEEAIAIARKELPDDGVMVVTGSLYMIPDALASLKASGV